VAAKTGNGVHVYFKMPGGADVRNSAGKVGQGIDVRGTGGYVVIPPSPHPDGGVYEWIKGREPTECPIAYAPTWLLERVLANPKRAHVHANPVEGSIIAGGRNQTLTSLGGTMRRRGMARDTILAALRAENDAKCAPPLEDDEVVRIADSVSRYEPADPTVVHQSATNSTTQNGTTQNGATQNGATPKRRDGDTTVRLDVVGIEVLERIAREKTQPIDAVPTPWDKWNRACRGAGGGVGLARGWHVIVGASSGAGKSLVAANLAASAVRSGVDVCLFSLEMSQLENVTRILSIMTGEPIRLLEHGESFSLDRWNAATEKFLEQPGTLRTNERPMHSLAQIEEAMRYHAAEGCRLMIVDYLQLAWVGRAETLYHQITEVSHTIQGLAKDLRVTTVGLSQVNRRTSSGADKLQKEGLMGGSSLENDAEQVVLLSKPERMYDGFQSEVRIDKNRHGPVAEWKMKLDPRTLQMSEAG
jgi:replicative DNA helicase